MLIFSMYVLAKVAMNKAIMEEMDDDDVEEDEEMDRGVLVEETGLHRTCAW